MALSPLDPLEEDAPLADINVTPLVDVMLVLLIIFMVAAPLMTAGINVALPKSTAQPQRPPAPPLVVGVDSEGRVFLDREELGGDSLTPRLEAEHRATPDRVVIVKADRSLTYGRVIEVMDLVSRAGFQKVSLLTESRGQRQGH
jgi:biopolymer transport protein TolR